MSIERLYIVHRHMPQFIKHVQSHKILENSVLQCASTEVPAGDKVGWVWRFNLFKEMWNSAKQWLFSQSIYRGSRRNPTYMNNELVTRTSLSACTEGANCSKIARNLSVAILSSNKWRRMLLLLFTIKTLGNMVVVFQTKTEFRYPKIAVMSVRETIYLGKNVLRLWTICNQHPHREHRPSPSIIVNIISFANFCLCLKTRTHMVWWHWVLNGNTCSVFVNTLGTRDPFQFFGWISWHYSE